MAKAPPFMAMIVPMGSAYPDNTLPAPGPGVPGQPPRPDQSLPPFPSHPIYFPPPGGQPPLGIWGPTDPRPGTGLPGDQPYPDQGLPGSQPHPDQGLPGAQPRPDHGLPPFAQHPIVLPPNLPPTIPGEGGGPERKVDWKCGWTESTGWVVVGIPAEGTLVPTPSKKK